MLRKTTLVTALLAAAALAGCGGSSGSKDDAGGGGAKATPTATPAPQGVEMTVGEGEDATTYRVSITSLAADGPFLTLNGAARCVKGPNDGCSLYSDFAGFNTYWDFSGIRLLDRDTQTSFQPVKNAGGGRLDTTYWASNTHDTSTEDMAPGQVQRFWVRYAAPPAGTPALDVLFPNGGPVVLGEPVTQGGVDTSPLPQGALPDGKSTFPDRDLASTDTGGLDLNTGKITAKVTSPRAQTVQRLGRRTVTLAADVLFDFDEATLDTAGEAEVDSVAADAKAHADGPVAIDGYTDSKGSDAYNLDLSRRRAQTVADALAPQLDGADLKVTGHGEADPVAPNTSGGADSPRGRAKNRRVTVGYAVRKDAKASAAPAATPTPASGSLPAPVEWTPTDDEDGTRFRAQVQPVQRVGSLAIARIDVTCLASGDDACGGAFAFEGGDAHDTLDQGGGNLRYASGIRLYEPSSRSTYVPAFGTDGTQLTTETALGVGRTTQVWAYYVAPPPSVRAVTVRLPHGGPDVTNVPVQ